MQNVNLNDVFTPATPATLTFVERVKINDRLVNAITTPGKQIIVYGYSGSGKTTLLNNKLSQIYENHITSRCISGMSLDGLIIDAFDQLSPYYQSENTTGTKSHKSMNFGAIFAAIPFGYASSKDTNNENKNSRALPPQLTAQNLARLFGEKSLCWVIEDFHKIADNDRRRLSQIMKVFMDMANDYKNLKVIAIGAVGTARQVVEYEPEMRNRVAEIYVELMNEEELSNIITKGGKLLNIRFPGDTTKAIIAYANGLPSVCHHLCLNTCLVAGVKETSGEAITIKKSEFEGGVRIYLDEASDTLKKDFEKALKYKHKKFNNPRIILKALSELPQEGVQRSEIYNHIRITEKNYPQGNLTLFLNNMLQNEGMLRYDENSGKYSFIDPLYRAFAKVYFAADPESASRSYARSYPVDLSADLSKAIEEFSKTITLFNNISFNKPK